MSHVIPQRVSYYLKVLQGRYQRSELLLADLLDGSKVSVRAGVDHDNWDGGRDGHDVLIYTPLAIYSSIDRQACNNFQDTLKTDLSMECGAVREEYIANVYIQVDATWENSEGAVPITLHSAINPEKLLMWKIGYYRVFISHRDAHKTKARELADLLEKYGCSCFVAHETIPANEEWQKTIVNGLWTMEVMLVFLTDDFDASCWTMQEVGWALGRDIPTVALKLGRKDPPGFISHLQALRGDIDNLSSSTPELFRLMLGATGREIRMHDVLISSLASSRNFNETIERFDKMNHSIQHLSTFEIERLNKAFIENDQIHGCAYRAYHNRLISFLNRVSGASYSVSKSGFKTEPS